VRLRRESKPCDLQLGRKEKRLRVNTSTTSTELSTATVKLGDLTELLNGAMTHAHAKSDLPVLNTVRLEATGLHLTATATDRYRLINGAITLEDSGQTLPASLISLADIKRILALLKGEGTRMDSLPVTISHAGDMVSVSTRGNAITVTLVAGTYPPFEKYLDTTTALVAQEVASFNPAYFADYAKIAGKGKPVSVHFTGAGKPMRIVFEGDNVEWKAILMPMRIK
jgi:DNA polymerase III sliding clamp (beta) subunit (PCNA family)